MADDKVLLVKGIAGLGNRILCALTGILYAQMSGRKLLIDWSDAIYSPDGSNIFGRLFRICSAATIEDLPSTESIYPDAWRGHLGESAKDVAERYGHIPTNVKSVLKLDLAKIDYREDIVVLVLYTAEIGALRRHFAGEMAALAGMTDEAILAKLLRENVELQPEIRQRVENFKREHFGARTVGVHVRYTDYRVRLLPIIRKLNQLLRSEPEMRIFLATDNIELKRAFEKSYTNVVTTPHWYPEAGEPIHKARGRPDRIESAIESLIDLYLLAECGELIVDATSSFAYVASLLSQARPESVHRVVTGEKHWSKRGNEVWSLARRWKLVSLSMRLFPRLVPIRKL
ncbi:MAG: hypothetical protein JO211_03560 [Acidobacteriaceae bacterium]|nr:hypothetical protein [Acidobacteriaceae bacterium]